MYKRGQMFDFTSVLWYNIIRGETMNEINLVEIIEKRYRRPGHYDMVVCYYIVDAITVMAYESFETPEEAIDYYWEKLPALELEEKL